MSCTNIIIYLELQTYTKLFILLKLFKYKVYWVYPNYRCNRLKFTQEKNIILSISYTMNFYVFLKWIVPVVSNLLESLLMWNCPVFSVHDTYPIPSLLPDVCMYKHKYQEINSPNCNHRTNISNCIKSSNMVIFHNFSIGSSFKDTLLVQIDKGLKRVMTFTTGIYFGHLNLSS